MPPLARLSMWSLLVASLLFVETDVFAQSVQVEGDSYVITNSSGATVLVGRDDDDDGDGVTAERELEGYRYDIATGEIVPCDPVVDTPCYQTNPLRWSTDGDPYSDFNEVSDLNMPNEVGPPYTHPLVPARPVLVATLEEYAVDPIAQITDSEGGSVSAEFGVEVSTETQVGGSTTVGAEMGTGGLSGSLEQEVNYSYTETYTTSSTFGSSIDWSTAITTDPSEAAALKLTIDYENVGSATAADVFPTFSVLVGERAIGTFTPETPINLMAPGSSSGPFVYPEVGEQRFVVTLDELRALEGGAPLRLVLVQIEADVLRWNADNQTWLCPDGENCSWAAFETQIDPISMQVHARMGEGERRDFQVFGGNESVGLDYTLRDVLELVLEVEGEGSEASIEARPYPDEWYVSSPTASFIAAWEQAGQPADLMDLPVEPGTRIDLFTPGSETGPHVALASFTDDFRDVRVSAWPRGGFSILEAEAFVTVEGVEQTIPLRRGEGETFYANPHSLPVAAWASGEVRVRDARGDATVLPLAAPEGVRATCVEVQDDLEAGEIPLPDDGNGGAEYVLFAEGNPEQPVNTYCRFFDDGSQPNSWVWIERAHPFSETENGLYDVTMPNDTTAFVVGNQALIVSRDVGRTWSPVELSSADEDLLQQTVLYGADFDGETGIAVGGTGSRCTVFRTEDGGADWSSVASCGTSRTFRGVASAGEGVWVAVGADRIMRSKDDGQTWTSAQSFPAISDMWGIAFGDDGVGMATDHARGVNGAGQVLLTKDGGVTWSRHGIFTGVRDLAHVDGEIFAVAGRNTVTLVPVSASGAWDVRQVDESSDVFDVVFPQPDIGFALGGNNTFFRSDDGGLTWTYTGPGMTFQPMRALTMYDANRGVGVGIRGGVVTTTSGGGNPVSRPVSVEDDTADLPDGIESAVILHPNYPNPFEAQTTIGFTLSRAGHVTLQVYDLLGREVKRLVDERKPSGEHTVAFEASHLSPGAYLLRLTTGDAHAYGTMMLVR